MIHLIPDPTPVIDETPPCPRGKGSGRTQWMIDRLIEAIREGQPRCMVVGHEWGFTKSYLRPRIIMALEAANLVITAGRGESILCEGTVISFHSRWSIAHDRRGVHGGEFWDHFADDDQSQAHVVTPSSTD